MQNYIQDLHYDVIAELTLCDYYSGNRTLYNDLKKLQRDSFLDNERIVISESTVGYLPAHKTILRLINDLDIPTFFVLVVTKSKAVYDFYLAEGITAVLVDGVPNEVDSNARHFFIDSDTFCINPWINVEVKNSGQYSVCCEYREKFPHSVSDTTAGDFMTSTEVGMLRQQMLDNKQPNGCKNCYTLEERGIKSKRLRDNFVYKEVKDTLDYRTPVVYSLDIKLGNVCNFACRICNEVNSSKWLSEKLTNKSKFNTIRIPSKPDWITDPESKFADSLNRLDMVSYLQFTGGEPLLIKEHYALLDYYIDRGLSQNISIHYNTNGSIYSDKIIEYASKFKSIELSFSLDDIGERFEYSRGGKWEEVKNNLLRYVRNKPSNVSYDVYATVSIFNILHLKDIFYSCRRIGMPFSLNFLNFPEIYDIKNLPVAVKQGILNELRINGSEEFDNDLAPVLEYMNKQGTMDMQLLFDEISRIDSIRNESFQNVYPTMYELLRKN